MATKKTAVAAAPKAAPVADVTPTVAEAKALFEERPDLASVLTVEGELLRDGTLIVAPKLAGE